MICSLSNCNLRKLKTCNGTNNGAKKSKRGCPFFEIRVGHFLQLYPLQLFICLVPNTVQKIRLYVDLVINSPFFHNVMCKFLDFTLIYTNLFLPTYVQSKFCNVGNSIFSGIFVQSDFLHSCLKIIS